MEQDKLDVFDVALGASLNYIRDLVNSESITESSDYTLTFTTEIIDKDNFTVSALHLMKIEK